jgi:hypothetical protein
MAGRTTPSPRVLGEQEAVEQYILEGNRYQLAQKLKDGQLSAEAIPGFSISVKAIFAD